MEKLLTEATHFHEPQKAEIEQVSIPCIAMPETDTATTVHADSVQDNSQHYILDSAQPLDQTSFPNSPRAGCSTTPTTLPNVQLLLKSYGITAQYNTIKKRLNIMVPGQSGSPDNADNIALAQIISLATLNGMSAGQVPYYVHCIADRNLYNPIASWIDSRPWDNKDRLPDICAVLVECEDYPAELKRTLLHRWLLSAVAAALMPSGFRGRGVLTLQGPQSIGKSTFFSSLIPDPVLRELAIKLDHHMDAGNKDSQLTAIGHWIVEIGELDSSFKKDVARLKGFLTSDRDKVRRPYARTDSEYPRRTVFCATVNDANFLVDATGNTRFWTIPVTKINYQHDIDMQQLFAQLAVEFRDKKQWWLTMDEEQLLEKFNKSHRIINAIHERVLSALDLTQSAQPNLRAMTASEVLIAIGIRNPSNTQCKDCAATLREFLGDSKRINGFMKWRVPLKYGSSDQLLPPARTVSDDDRF